MPQRREYIYAISGIREQSLNIQYKSPLKLAQKKAFHLRPCFHAPLYISIMRVI